VRASAQSPAHQARRRHLLNKLGLRDRVQAVVILTEKDSCPQRCHPATAIHPDDRLDTAVSQQGGSQTKYLTLAPQRE
jgi:hypothetical protein